MQAERARLQGSEDPAARAAGAAPVVIMTREAHTCAQLREVRAAYLLASWQIVYLRAGLVVTYCEPYRGLGTAI